MDLLLQTAMLERGTGSVRRQKDYVHGFIERERHTLFSGGSNVLMERLVQAAEVSIRESRALRVVSETSS